MILRILKPHFFFSSDAFIIVLFLALTIGSSLTHRPQVDEGMFASPAFNLAYHGHFGTTIFDMEVSNLTRIDQRTYWVMPLFLLNVATSFKVLGFSLFAMRLVSVFWGLILLAAGYFIVLKLSENKFTAVLGMFLIACNYTVLDTASSGRMDLMSASSGFAGIAAYLLLRESNLSRAVFLSQLLVCASGLTHHNGIMAFAGLIFLTFYFDFRRLGWKHLAIGISPYIVGGTLFGIWVLQDPIAFRDQFIDNAIMGGRLGGFSSPFDGIIREFTERYPQAHGLGNTSGGHSGPIYLKSLVLVGYVIGIFGVLFTKSLRKKYLPLLVLGVIYFLILGIIDGQKETPYLIHIVPLYCALLAIWISWVWNKKSVPVSLLCVGILIFTGLQVGGMALRIKQNTYANFYQPTVNYLKENTSENDIIYGGAELVIGLNFSKRLSGDPRFGHKTGKKAKFIVVDDAISSSVADTKEKSPEFYDYYTRMLDDEYELAYENNSYKVYRLK